MNNALTGNPDPSALREGVDIILREKVSPADANLSALLGILQARGTDEESVFALVDEILRFERYRPFYYSLPGIENIVCVAGSGKKFLKTLNITTIATLVASDLGVNIVKPTSHGVTSILGSGDLLEILGIRVCRNVDEAGKMLRITGVAYFSIENLIPDFDARYGGRQLTISPLSYLLPPLMSPIKCDHVFYGLSDSLVEKSASLVSRYCRSGNVTVVSSSIGGGFIDELLFNGNSRMYIVNGKSLELTPNWFFEDERVISDAIRVRDTKQSALARIDDVIYGRADNPYVRTICLNAAAMMLTGGISGSLKTAYEQAHDYILGGRLRGRIQSIRDAQMMD